MSIPSPEIDCNCDTLGETHCEEYMGKIIRYAYCTRCGEKHIEEAD